MCLFEVSNFTLLNLIKMYWQYDSTTCLVHLRIIQIHLKSYFTCCLVICMKIIYLHLKSVVVWVGNKVKTEINKIDGRERKKGNFKQSKYSEFYLYFF